MSKGMQQRLGIAQAMVGDPRLLLLDEPTSALDPAGRRTVRELLEGLRGRGVAVLLNSHLLSEVELVCDRVVIIARGEVVAAGTPAELSTRRRRRGRDRRAACGASRRPTREDVPRIVRELVAAGEDVYGVRVVRSSLEDAYLERGRRRDEGASAIVAGFALRESVRRRVFVVVALLTVAFLGALRPRRLAASRARWTSRPAPQGVDGEIVAGATLLGLAMFATLFLGAILAVFLTLGAVRGDAERGLLQPLLVRPLGARDVPARALRGRGGRVRGLRVVRLPRLGRDHRRASSTGGRTGCSCPRSRWRVGVAVIAALALGGSVVLSSTANGIAIFMLFGAGLTAGLLGPDRRGAELGHARERLAHRVVGAAVRGALPDGAERRSRPTRSASPASRSTSARSAARRSSARCCGRTRVLYLGAIGAVALWAFRRRDL